jgi:hypothetical protein
MQVKITLRNHKAKTLLLELTKDGILLENVECKEDAQAVILTLFHWEEIKDK